LLTVNRLAG